MPIHSGDRVRFSKKLIYRNRKPYRQRLTFHKGTNRVEEVVLFRVCPHCGHTKVSRGGNRCPKCRKHMN